MSAPILTDAQGRPFERPTPPAADATSDQVVAYLRAHAAFNDAVTSCAGRAFTRRLARQVRRAALVLAVLLAGCVEDIPLVEGGPCCLRWPREDAVVACWAERKEADETFLWGCVDFTCDAVGFEQTLCWSEHDRELQPVE